MNIHSSKPNVLDIWQHIEPRFGGVGPAASSLARAAAAGANGWRFSQIAYCDPNEYKLSDDINSSVKIVKIPGIRPMVDRNLRLELADHITSTSLCHIHGVWQPHSLAVQALASRFKKPVVASTHGMLESWELSHKRIRKSLYSTLFERRALSRSFCLRALSIQEARDYRRYGLTGPIAIVPNGVKRLHRGDTSLILNKYPELKGKAVVLFLGRIHPKKGILNLLHAWPDILKTTPHAHLLIAGPEYAETGYKARTIIRDSKVEHSVTFSGTISGEEKMSALSVAQCLCLPSYSEGLSISVLEALSIGLPVVVTAACNVDGITESGAGYVTSNDPLALSSALPKVLLRSPADWKRMSCAAETLARTQYDWGYIGKTMLSVYEWMLGGQKPDSVITEPSLDHYFAWSSGNLQVARVGGA